MVEDKRWVFALRHIEHQRFLSALIDGLDYLICFSNQQDAYQFQDELGTVEHNEIVDLLITDIPNGRLFFDGQKVVIQNTPTNILPYEA